MVGEKWQTERRHARLKWGCVVDVDVGTVGAEKQGYWMVLITHNSAPYSTLAEPGSISSDIGDESFLMPNLSLLFRQLRDWKVSWVRRLEHRVQPLNIYVDLCRGHAGDL